MNGLYTLNSFSSQQYFNNNANSTNFKKIGILVCTTDLRNMQIVDEFVYIEQLYQSTIFLQ